MVCVCPCTSGPWHNSTVSGSKSHSMSMALYHTAPVIKSPPHCLVAVRCKSAAGHGQLRVFITPIAASLQLNVRLLNVIISVGHPSN